VASKKITDLSAQTGVTADDLIIVVDMAGPTTYKITVANLVNSIPSNTSFAANVAIIGELTANAATFAGNVSADTIKYVVANNFLVKKTTTPSSSTDSVTAADIGKFWSDGSFLYAQANATHYKRVAIATF